jgi:acetyl-CoA carboxylase biotin carboxyl carrier protein
MMAFPQAYPSFGGYQQQMPQGYPGYAPQMPPQAPPAAPAAAPPPQPQAPAPDAAPSGEAVRAPIVGTFYAAPSPEADPFVQVGSKVAVGDVLCIIEAMKLMNEIEAEVAGTIVEVLVANAEAVEYDQPLFRIEPA